MSNDWASAIDEDEDAVRRKAESEARRFEAEFGMRPAKAMAVAYHRLGFSPSGTAKRIDRNTSTVKGYYNEVDDEFGKEALFAHHRDVTDDPLTDRTRGQSSATDVAESDPTHSTDPAGDGTDGDLNPFADIDEFDN